MTDIQTKYLFEAIFLPPGIIVLTLLLVLLTATIKPRLFTRLIFLSMFFLWLFSTPIFSYWASGLLQKDYPILTEIPTDADVIILMGGEQTEGYNEYGSRAMLGGKALERARYAAYLANKSGLPIIVTGGLTVDQGISHAELMKKFLKKELKVHSVITENKSQSTYQNALFSASLLRQHHFDKPLLVTHAWHMPRSVGAFEHFEVSVYPAPTSHNSSSEAESGYFEWIPTARGLLRTRVFFHEIIGQIYYHFKYYAK